MEIDLVAKGIKEREVALSRGMQFTRVGDPHIWDEDGGESVGKSFQRNGIYIKKGDNTRMAGKMQLHYRLSMRPEGCPIINEHQMGKPGLYVFSICRAFIRTIPALSYSILRPEDVDSDGEDHCITGDTLIVTSEGIKSISEMAGTDGMVFSSDGKFHKYTDARMTQESAQVYEVKLDDGTTVKATANHRFRLADGTWKRLDELCVDDELMKILA